MLLKTIVGFLSRDEESKKPKISRKKLKILLSVIILVIAIDMVSYVLLINDLDSPMAQKLMVFSTDIFSDLAEIFK